MHLQVAQPRRTMLTLRRHGCDHHGMDARGAATEIVRRLRDAGFDALFNGGCVRDQLLGRTPKDYDVATSAPAERVLALFPGSLPVGVQFGVVLVPTHG